MLLNCGVGEDSWEYLGQQRSNQSMLKEISPEYSLEGFMLKLKLQYLGHLIQRAYWLTVVGQTGPAWASLLTHRAGTCVNTKRSAWRYGLKCIFLASLKYGSVIVVEGCVSPWNWAGWPLMGLTLHTAPPPFPAPSPPLPPAGPFPQGWTWPVPLARSALGLLSGIWGRGSSTCLLPLCRIRGEAFTRHTRDPSPFHGLTRNYMWPLNTSHNQ